MMMKQPSVTALLPMTMELREKTEHEAVFALEGAHDGRTIEMRFKADDRKIDACFPEGTPEKLLVLAVSNPDGLDAMVAEAASADFERASDITRRIGFNADHNKVGSC
jgi:hypothetical protein